MNLSKQPKTFENYFDFFENKSKSLARVCKWALLILTCTGILFVVLLHSGVVNVPKPHVDAHSTPAPTPVHYLETLAN